MNFRWWLDLELNWHSDPGIRPNVLDAINKWKAAGAVPELTWLEVTDVTQAHVSFVINREGCTGGNQVPAVTRVTELVDDTIRQARYSRKFEVCVNTINYTYGPKALTGTVAHEVGHIYGLSEKYRDDPPSPTPTLPGPFCRAEKTVMNGVETDPRPGLNNEFIFCYSQKNDVGTVDGPASTDITRTRDFWSLGREVFSTLDRPNANTLRVKYRDAAWAEVAHRLNLYYWDGTQWLLVRAEDSIGSTGIHRLTTVTSERIIEHLFDITLLPRDKSYLVCGKPTFSGFPSASSNWECSNVLFVAAP